MSLRIVVETCIGCGACDYGCPTEAIHAPHPSSISPAFWIESDRCNDCHWCTTVCPVDCIVVDERSIVCMGRGCPVAEGKKGPAAGWTCSLQVERCPMCGDPLWTPPDANMPRCARCDLGMQVGCPKTLRLRRKGELAGL